MEMAHSPQETIVRRIERGLGPKLNLYQEADAEGGLVHTINEILINTALGNGIYVRKAQDSVKYTA